MATLINDNLYRKRGKEISWPCRNGLTFATISNDYVQYKNGESGNWLLQGLCCLMWAAAGILTCRIRTHAPPSSFCTIFTIGPSQTFCQIAAICSTALANPEFSPSRQAVRTRGGWGKPSRNTLLLCVYKHRHKHPPSPGDVQKVGPVLGRGTKRRRWGGKRAAC